MKWLRKILLLVCLVASSALAQPQFDTNTLAIGTGNGSTSPISVTVQIASKETAFAIFSGTPSTGSIAVTSITGGGTWTLVKAFGTTQRVEIWSTVVNASANAASISVAYSGTASNANVAVGHYVGGGSILVANAVTNSGSTANPTISLTTTLSNSFVIAGFSAASTFAPTAGTGNLRVKAGLAGAAVALVDNTSGSPTSVTCSITLAATTWSAVAVELTVASPPLVQFDETLANSAVGAAVTTSPLSVTITIVAGETGFCAIAFDGTVAGDSVTSITGGGTWTAVGTENAAASARAELWTNGVGGGVGASSISIAFTGTVVDVNAACGQYQNVSAILTANKIVANGTTSPVTIALTTTGLGSVVVAAMADKGASTPTMKQSTGNLRRTTGNTVLSGGISDNYSATAVSTTNAVTISVTSLDWAAVAVELTAKATSPVLMMMGIGQ